MVDFLREKHYKTFQKILSKKEYKILYSICSILSFGEIK